MGLSGILGDIGGGFVDAVSTTYDKSQADWAVRKSHIDDTGKAVWGHALKPTLDGFEWVYRNGVSRPLTTLFLMQDDDTEHGKGWAGAWKESRNISPGQAFTDSLANRFDDAAQKFGIDNPLEWADTKVNLGPLGKTPLFFFGDDLETSFEELTGSGGKSQFDIFNEEQRKAVFGHNFAKGLSGISDTAIRWFLDPTVIAGKAAMAGRTRLLVRPISHAGTEAEITARVDKAFDPATTTGRRMQAVADRYMGMTEDQRRIALLKDKQLGRQSVAAAELLARSTDAPDFLIRLRTMLNPTDENLANLGTRAGSSWDEFVKYTDGRKQGFEDALREADDELRAARNTGRIDETAPAFETKRKAFRDLREYRNAEVAAAKAMEFTELMHAATSRKLYIPPRYTVAQRAGDLSAAKLRGGEQSIYQPSRFSAVRVVKSATSTRVGVVRHDDPDSAIREVTALINRAGHGVVALPGRSRGLDKDVAATLIKNVSHAVTLSDHTAVAGAVRDVEREVIRHNAELIGVRPEVAEALYRRFNQKRNSTVQTYSAKTGDPNSAALRVKMDSAGNPVTSVPPPEPSFSGARAPGAGPGDPYVDMWFKDADGTYTHVPIANTDIVNTTPMIDIDSFTRLLRKEKLAINSEGDELVQLLREGQRKDGVDALADDFIGGDSLISSSNEMAKEALQKFNQLWKPMQLMRLGWPMRVVVDEQMRIMAALGATDYMEYVTRSLGNSLSHGKVGVNVRDVARTPWRRVAQRQVDRKGPVRAEGKVKYGLFDELDDLAAHSNELGARTEATRRRLEAAVAESGDGARIYRSAPINSPIRPEEFGTEFRYDLPEEVMARTHVHQYAVSDRLTDAQIFRLARDSDGLHPGTEYLNQSPSRVDLQPMLARDLRQHILTEFPGAKIAKYRSKADLTEAYGRLVARRDGVKVIEAEGQGVTALTRDSIVKVDPDEARAMARLEDLQQEALLNAERRGKLTNDAQPLRDWTEQMETDYQRVVRKATKYRQLERGDPLRPHKFAGTIVLRKNGVTLEVPDALAGAYGRMFMDLTSAASTTRALAGIEAHHLNNLRVVGGDTLNVTSTVTPSMTSAERTLRRQTYDSGWESAVNRQIGQDAMLRQIVMGRTDEEILGWMTAAPEGRTYMRKAAPLLRENKEEWVARARVHVDHYLPDSPDDLLRTKALAGEVKASDLRELNKALGKSESELPIVHAQSLDLVTGKSVFMNRISRTVDFAYAKLGTAPTDVLSRHPFFAAVYKNEMQRQFDGMALKSTDNVTDFQIQQMQSQARNTALGEVKRTLYDVANQSNLGHAMRFMMPFYAAWQDALQTWGRLFMEDPSRLAHMVQAWEAPSKSAQAYTSPDGTVYMATPLPAFAKKVLGLPENGLMPADALKGLIAQGDYWYMPGFGAPVTVPVSALVRNKPSLEESLRPVLPFGAGQDYLDQILPAGWKRQRSLNNEEDDASYAKALVRMAQDVYVDNRKDKLGMTDTQMWDEAKRRTDSLFTVKRAANLMLPFSPKINSPYQLYIDAWQVMQEKQRLNPKAFGLDGSGKPVTAQDAFVDKYGEDYFAFTVAATKSNVGGISPTTEGYKAFNQYRDLVREMPEMGSLIVGDTAGDYSAAVSDWMTTERIGPGDARHLRDIRDPSTAFKDLETNRGWTLFRKMDVTIDAEMARLGVKSLRAKKAAPLKALRDAYIADIKTKYPAWAEEFSVFDRGKADRRVAFMEKLAEDDRVRDRPGFASLTKYLAIRRQVVAELAARPSKNLQAQSNGDLKILFDALVTGLRQGDTYFADLHTRWLSSDDLDTGGVA